MYSATVKIMPTYLTILLRRINCLSLILNSDYAK